MKINIFRGDPSDVLAKKNFNAGEPAFHSTVTWKIYALNQVWVSFTALSPGKSTSWARFACFSHHCHLKNLRVGSAVLNRALEVNMKPNTVCAYDARNAPHRCLLWQETRRFDYCEHLLFILTWFAEVRVRGCPRLLLKVPQRLELASQNHLEGAGQSLSKIPLSIGRLQLMYKMALKILSLAKSWNKNHRIMLQQRSFILICVEWMVSWEN